MSNPLTPFETWWHNEGSELSPLPGEDYEQHARRVSAIAWENGAFSTAHNELRNALEDVMLWINNWTPPFVEDAEWDATECLVKAALAKGGARS